MKIVLGVDSRTPEANAPVVSLLERLAFDGGEIEVVHIVAPPVFPGGELIPVLSGIVTAGYESTEWPEASQAVADVAQALSGAYPTTESVVMGDPAQTLLTTATHSGAALLALNASHDPAWTSAFVGSVSRAAVLEASQSILLARATHDPSRPLHAVFATDHSPYAETCATLLGDLLPRGIAALTILTAFPIAVLSEQLAQGEPGITAGIKVESELLDRNDDTIARLTAAFAGAGPTMLSRVVDQPIDEAIEDAMAETEADLLILGAHSHSLIERLLAGSISLRQALHSPYSVLLLRPS